jgi:PAS domain S-box-containing protein
MHPHRVAFTVVNQVSAMVAYWDSNQRCVFSNEAYRHWFGKTPDEMVGMSMKELLGPLYEQNLPYILKVLDGEKQVFERRIPLPTGGARDTIATYTPDVLDGVVRGFSVLVADVTILREREAELQRAIRERDEALAQVRTLRGLLPICASCKAIRGPEGTWHPLEEYVSTRTDAEFSHGVCPGCAAKLYPEVQLSMPPTG